MDAGSTIPEAIKNTMKQIEGSLEKRYSLEGPVQFDFSVVQEVGVGGGLNFRIIRGDSNVKSEAVQQVSFAVKPKNCVEEEAYAKFNQLLLQFLNHLEKSCFQQLPVLEGEKQ